MQDVDRAVANLLQELGRLQEELTVVSRLTENEVEDVGRREGLLRLKGSKDRLSIGVEDAHLLRLLSEYMRIVDADRKNQFVNINKLNDESNWLRDEVAYLQQNLRKSDERIVELEEENNHLKFLLELKAIGGESSEKEGGDDKDLSIKFESFITHEDKDARDLDGEDENKESPNSEIATNQSATPGFELPPRLKTLHNLVIQYAAQGRYEVAIPLCKQTLEDLERTSGRNHPDVATMLNILALVYRDQNKFADAVNLLKEALCIREATLGPVHVAVAANLNNLAVLYGKQKKFQEAEPLCKRSLMIREQILGSDHPDVAKQLNNLALLCQNQGKYSEVEAYYHKAIKIYSDAFGRNCPDVKKTKNNLAAAYMKQSKYKEAELLYKEIINEMHDAMCGEIAPNNLPIWMLAEEKQYGKEGSANTKDDGRNSWNKILNKDWSQCYSTLKNLASLYRRQNKIDAADIIDDLANRNILRPGENTQLCHESFPEKSSELNNQEVSRDRPSSVCINQEAWNIARTNQMKANLAVKPNNFNKPLGPMKASRTSLADKFTSKFAKTPGNMRENTLSVVSWQSSGDGRLKKASSMSTLSGAPQNKNNQNFIMTPKQQGQTWLSKGRTSSIENIKKAFGKRA